MLVRNRNYNFFDDFFQDMFDDSFFFKSAGNNTGLMKTDIKERDGKFLLDIDLPGYEKNDIHAELKDGYLTISAEKTEENEEKDDKGNYIRRERYCGSVKRNFYVGKDLKEENIQAEFVNGVLKLMVTKPEPKAIEDTKKLIPIL